MKHLKKYENLSDIKYLDEFTYDNIQTKNFLIKYIKYIDASELGSTITLWPLIEKILYTLSSGIFDQNFRKIELVSSGIKNTFSGNLYFSQLDEKAIKNIKLLFEIIECNEDIIIDPDDYNIIVFFKIKDINIAIENLFIRIESKNYNI